MPQPNRPGRDVAAEITDLIIRKLEEGVPPWSRPWSMSHAGGRSEEHTSELQSLMRNSYAVFCLKKKKTTATHLAQTTLLQTCKNSKHIYAAIAHISYATTNHNN